MKTRSFSWKNSCSRFYVQLKKQLQLFRSAGLVDESEFRFHVEDLEPRQMLSVSLGFDHLVDGTLFQAGDRLTEQYAEIGVQVFTHSSDHPAMIFDSENVSADKAELGSSHQDFGGVGLGAGGRAGQPGANSLSQGKVLVLSADNDANDPKSLDSGGSIFFQFDQSVTIESLGLLDIDEDETVQLKFYDQHQHLIADQTITGLGDNAFQSIAPGVSGVTQLEVTLSGTGAVTELTFTESTDKFYVVDQRADHTFVYDAVGDSVDQFSLESARRARGVAFTDDGTRMLVLNADRRVHVFDVDTQTELGSWQANGLISVQGIAVDGDDVLILDRIRKKVFRFEDSTNTLDGHRNASSSFRLNFWNFNASGLTTDGDTIWVADRTLDRIFVYDAQGHVEGSWRLDRSNRRPTGVALDPADPDGLYVLDARTDEVFYYAQGRHARSGRLNVTSRFLLDSANFRGEGLAVVPEVDLPLTQPEIIRFDDDTGASSEDRITSDNTLVFSGTADPGVAIVLSESGLGELGNAVADEGGTWSIDASNINLVDGNFEFFATAINNAGDQRESDRISVWVDTLAPANTAILSITEDTGLSDSDGFTSDGSLVIEGIAEPNSLLELNEASLGLLGSATVDATGSWSFDLTDSILPEGDYSFSARAVDLAGNVSEWTDPTSVTVDQTPPTTPQILSISEDSGRSGGDQITNVTTQRIQGTGEAGSVISLFDSDSAELGTTTVDPLGDWFLDLEFTDGVYELTATAVELAGNTSPSSSVFFLEIDTEPPIAPTLTLDPAFDTSPVGDQTTTLSLVTLIGTTSSNAEIRLVETGQTTLSDEEGNFVFENVELVTGSSGTGENVFTVIATDVAGNISQGSQSIFYLDEEAPIIQAELLNDTGPNASDRFTTDPTLTGSILDSQIVDASFTLFTRDQPTGFTADLTPLLQADGSFEISPQLMADLVGGLLPYGQFLYSISAADSSGNQSQFNGDFTYIESDQDEITPPEIIVALANDTGDPTDKRTTDPALSGLVIDESPVDLSAQWVNLTTQESFIDSLNDILLPTGEFLLSRNRIEAFTGALSPGPYSVLIVGQDRYTTTAVPFDFVLEDDQVAPTVDGIDLDTGLSNTDGVTQDRSPRIFGTGEADTVVTWSIEAAGLGGTAPVNAAGEWSFEVPTELAEGSYQVIVSTLDGTSSSAPFGLTIDGTAPYRFDFGLDAASDSGTVGDGVTSQSLVVLRGETEPGSLVQLVGGNQSAIADVAGVFQLENVELKAGRHDYILEATDPAGNRRRATRSLLLDQPLILSEGEFASEATREVELGQESQTIRFRIDADFGSGNSPVVDDVFAVYLVDPDDPSQTLSDRGQNGTSLFSLIGGKPDYVAGQVRFDGTEVEIDVPSEVESTRGLLVFQWLNNDTDNDATITISEIGSYADTDNVATPAQNAREPVQPGGILATESLFVAENLDLELANVRFDGVNYRAEARLVNRGADVGNRLAVRFDDMPAGVSLLNASGQDGNGRAYLNFQSALPSYGLLGGQVSEFLAIEFTASELSPFANGLTVLSGGENQAPQIDAVAPVDVQPGSVARVQLSAFDPDAGEFYFRLGELPSETPPFQLTASGELIFRPRPEDVGTYQLEVQVSDGLAVSSTTITLNVVADPVTITRLSGWVLDVDGTPLEGIPAELGAVQTLTDATGYFELAFVGSFPSDTLLIRGEEFVGDAVYPFIAEKIPLMIGHDGYENVNNVIERPIYLPALDVDNGVTIDPAIDTEVTTSNIPHARVFVAAGSLETQGGELFTGDLSITEVPVDLTPAALPENLIPDLVVTIQPGEMVFTEPAPLELPNLSNYLPGTELRLWSINPTTGQFDDVGKGIVAADGTAIETVEGGVRNSSWHFFSLVAPEVFIDNPRNINKGCVECEEIYRAYHDNNNDCGDDDANLDTDLDLPAQDPHGGQQPYVPPTGSRQPLTITDKEERDPGLGVTENSTDNVVGTNDPATLREELNSNDLAAALHSGAVHKSHQLAGYSSLGIYRALELNYDSERADARPVVSTRITNVANNVPEPILASSLTVSRGNVVVQAQGASGGTGTGLVGGENFFRITPGTNNTDTSLQVDLRGQASGVYQYQTANRFTSPNATGRFIGTNANATGELIHVNSLNSVFGAGWGIAGLKEIVENPDGSVLIINGDGSELHFRSDGMGGYLSPPDDFSTLVKRVDGRFERTHTDQKIERFNLSHQIESITDRNNNQLQFNYNSDGNIDSIVDPVGLTTLFRYTNGMVSEIEDPAGRITVLAHEGRNLVQIADPDASTRQFEYDSFHRLTGEIDKRGASDSIRYGFSGRVEEITRRDGSSVSISPVQTQALLRPEQTADTQDLVSTQDLGPEANAQVTDANGNVIRQQLDAQGQQVSTTDGIGEQGSVSRNDNNLVERIVDGRGNVTTLEYDERGNVISVVDAISRGSQSGPLFSGLQFKTNQNALAIVAADLNGDGFVDLVTQNDISDSVGVFLSRDGTGFEPPTDYAVDNPAQVAAGDVNQDGHQDLAVVSRNGNVSILLGDGTGALVNSGNFATGTTPVDVEVVDVNADGNLDLVVANESDGTVSVMSGNGTGTFAEPRTDLSAIPFVKYLAVGDLNRDGRIDIVAANDRSTEGLVVFVNQGDGNFETTIMDSPERTENVELGDVTGDGIIDILTGDSSLLVFPGIGDGTFAAPTATTVNGTTGTTWFQPLDIDGDGDQDVVFTETAIDRLTVLENDGSGNFSIGQTIETPDGPFSTILADFNLDGQRDVVTLAANADEIVVYLDQGTQLAPLGGTPDPDVPAGNGPNVMVAGDVNGDGLPDLVVGNQNEDSVTVYLGDGTGGLVELAPFAAGGLITSMQLRDLNDDTLLDLVSTHYNDDQIQVRLGDGSGAFSTPVVISAPEGPLDVVVGDFNNDGFEDIAASGHRGGGEPWFILAAGNGDGTFGLPVETSSRFQASSIVAGDLNNDGNLDLAIGVSFFSNGNAVRTFLGNGDGTFVDLERTEFGGGSFAGPPRELKLADLNRDGKLDIVGVDGPTNSVRVLIGNGDGTYQSVASYRASGGPRDIQVADFNSDGLQDVVFTNEDSGQVSVLLGDGRGGLGNRVDYRAADFVQRIVVADFNVDGVPDYAASHFNQDAIGLRLNQSDGVGTSRFQLVYDDVFNQLIQTVDEEGRVVLYDLDPNNGNRIRETIIVDQPGGDDDVVTQWTYTASGLIETMTDPLGRVTRYQYNPQQLVEKITFAEGTTEEASVEYGYDAAGNKTTVIDELGHRTEHLYDSLNRLERTTEPDPDGAGIATSPVSNWNYDEHGNLLLFTDALLNTTEYRYDELHRLIEKTDADGNRWTYEYDSAGNVTLSRDRLGRETHFEYDQRNRLIRTINAEFGIRTMVYDADDNLINVTDENGVRTSTVYDARNRVTREIDGEGGLTQFQYDRVDNLVARVDELGRRTELTFDELDRLIVQTLPDPDGEGPEGLPVTRFEYDTASNLERITDALGNVTVFEYDERNRQSAQLDPDPDGDGPLVAPVTEWVYDAGNRLVEMTDPLGRTSTYVYDDLDRQIRWTLADPDGVGPLTSPVFEYKYDAEDNLVSSIDALGNVTTYQYDNLYRRTRIIEADPDGAGALLAPETEYIYDAEDQMTAMVDPLGRRTIYRYDQLGRRTQTILPDPDQAGPDISPIMVYRYDGVGNEVARVDALGNETRYQFDNNYRLVQSIEADPDGLGALQSPITRFEYDAADQLIAVTDGLNRRTDYVYDRLGRAIEMALPDPDRGGPIGRSVFATRYDLIGNVLARVDALGIETAYEYDNLYRLERLIEADPDGDGPDGQAITTYQYDVASQLLAITDPINRTTQFVYDQLGRTIEEVYPDPDGPGPDGVPRVLYRYDAMGNRVARTDQLGYQTEFVFDNLYRLTTVVEEDPDGVGPESNPISRFEYDVASQMTAKVDPLGRRTTMDYDDLGRMVRLVMPDPDADGILSAPEFTYAYDSMNNQTSMIDALGNLTEFQYDNLYRRIRTIEADPDGAGPASRPITELVYDAEDQLVSIKDPLGRTSSFTFDDLGRLVERVEPDPDGAGVEAAPVTRYEYDLMSNQTRMIDALGLETVQEYDRLYRVVRVLDQDPDGIGPQEGPVTEMKYDLADQLIQFTDPLDRTTQYERDDLGRVIRVVQPDPDGPGALASPEWVKRYDLYGNLLSTTDPNGNTTEYIYDQLHRIVEERGQDIDGAGPNDAPVTQFRYDRKGNLLTFTDSGGNVTSYQYDDLDRQIAETIELGVGNFQSRWFEYDSMNNLVRKTDRNERVTEFEFDNLYRQIEERWFDSTGGLVNTLQYGYDSADQLLSGLDLAADSLNTFEYDGLGRLMRTTSDNGGSVVESVSTFDANHRLVSRSTFIDGVGDVENRYQYDGLNRVSQVSQSGLSGIHPVNQKRVDVDYNAANQLVGVQRFADLAGTSLVAATSHLYDGIGRLTDIQHQGIANHEYEFDPGSRIERVSHSVDGTSDIQYDRINQVTGEQHSFQEDRNYELDELGNRIGPGVVLGPYNRVVTEGDFDYEYDDEGNRTKRINTATGETREYVWDHRNRLVSVVDRLVDGGSITGQVDHRYDVFNQWISKSVDVDGVGAAAAELTRYFYAGGQLDLELDSVGDPAHRYLWLPGNDLLLVDEDVAEGQNRWALSDHLNSVRDWVSDSGTVLNHVTYDVYGNVTSVSDPGFSSLVGYTGRPFEASTGMQNNLHRWYEPATGRWTSEDPISFDGGDANLYRYVGNDVLGQVDPDGLKAEDGLYALLGEKMYEAKQNGAQSYRNFQELVRPLEPYTDAFGHAITNVKSAADQTFNIVNVPAFLLTQNYDQAQFLLTGKTDSPLVDPTIDLRNYQRQYGNKWLRDKLQRGYDYGRLAEAVYKIKETRVGRRL